MLDAKDAQDLLSIINGFRGYAGADVERIAELKAKLKAIAEGEKKT